MSVSLPGATELTLSAWLDDGCKTAVIVAEFIMHFSDHAFAVANSDIGSRNSILTDGTSASPAQPQTTAMEGHCGTSAFETVGGDSQEDGGLATANTLSSSNLMNGSFRVTRLDR